MNGYFVSTDVDQYHITLTRQEGYRVVRAALDIFYDIRINTNLMMLIWMVKTHVLVQTGDAESWASEQRESCRGLQLGPMGLGYSKTLLPHCTGQNLFQLTFTVVWPYYFYGYFFPSYRRNTHWSVHSFTPIATLRLW